MAAGDLSWWQNACAANFAAASRKVLRSKLFFWVGRWEEGGGAALGACERLRAIDGHVLTSPPPFLRFSRCGPNPSVAHNMSVPRAVLTLACAAAAALAIASTPVHADVCEDVDGWVDEYGYDCAYWGKDMNGCHLSEIDYLYDNMDIPDIVRDQILVFKYQGITEYWLGEIRTNCPKACGMCNPKKAAAKRAVKKAKALAKACKKTLKSKKCKKAIKKAPECLYEYLA